MQTKLIRWVLAHEPIEIFIRAAEQFKAIVEKNAPGYFNIEILTLSDYAKKYNNGNKITKNQLLDLLSSDQIEMSQMYTYVLAKYNQDLHALDMPFLFQDHDHATRVFEGEIGQELLQGYAKNASNIKGMAFTYSGGFMNVPVSKQINDLTDLAGAKVRVSNSPVAQDTWTALGAHPVVMDIEDLSNGLKTGEVDGGESSWPRIYPCGQAAVSKSILNSQHRLLLTNIIINDKFLSTLPANIQDIMFAAAIEAARFERQISIDDVAPTSQRARQDGISVLDLSDTDKRQLSAVTESVYEKYKDFFTNNLINRIKQA